MRDRPNGPSFHTLRRTSPALNEVLRVCFLRAAFQADPQFSSVRSLSTAATLGTVSHRLLESAARGELDDTLEQNLDTVVAKRWDKLVKSEEKALQRQAHGSVPAHIRWPKHALRKVSACKAASRIALQRRRGFRGVSAAALSPNPTGTEVWYEGYEGRLAGRIDLVRRTSSGIEVIDYKSGIVVEQGAVEGTANRVREDYERQVLLYSALVYANERQWPIKVTVESLVQGPHEVDVTPDRAQGAVEEALGLLDAYNRKATAGTVRGQPDPNACRWCDFKAVCRDFLETAEESWAGSSRTIAGTLRTVHAGLASYLGVDVIGGDHPRASITVRGVPEHVASELNGSEGSSLSLGGVRRSLGSNDLLFNWTSQGWRWPSINK